MRKLIIILLLLAGFVSHSQKLQNITGYGVQARRIVADTLIGIPNDTFAVPTALNTIRFLANKGGTLYAWNTSLLRWSSVGGGAATVTGASNGDTLVSGNIEIGSRLTRPTRIDLNDNLFYFQHTSDAIANTLTINLDENDGQVVLDNSGGALIETGFKYVGYDFGLVKNRVQNLYASTSNGAAVGHDFIDAWGHLTQIYQGTPYNAFTSGGLMIRYTGNSMKLHVDSAGGFIGFNVGALGGMTTNEQGRVNQTGWGLGTTVPTHRLTVNGQVKVFAPQAGDVDSVATWKDGVLSATLASALSGVNIYNSNGTLTGDRTLSLNNNTFWIESGASGSGENILTLEQNGAASWKIGNSVARSFIEDDGVYLRISATDSLLFSQSAGYYRFLAVPYGSIDTTTYKPFAIGPSGIVRRMNSWAQVSAGGGSAALTATYAGYGDGSNVLTGEAAYNYNATTNTLDVDNITMTGAGSTLAITPVSGTATWTMTSSAGAFSNTWTYDASRNSILDMRDGVNVRVNSNNMLSITSTGLTVNQGGGTASDFNVRSANFNPFVFVDVSADRMGIGVTTVAQLTNTLTVNGSIRFSTIPTGSAVDSFGTYDNGVLEMVAPADMTGLPYVALTGVSTATGDIELVNLGETLIGDQTNHSYILIAGNTAGSPLTMTYRADNGHIFQSGIVTMSAYGAGAATFDAAGVISSVSDERAKMDIQYYAGGIDAVLRFNPISYRYNGITGNETEHTYLGFSAQNVHSVLGDLGTGIGKDGLMTLQDRSILATLVNGEKDLYRMIMELRAEIETLKRK